MTTFIRLLFTIFLLVLAAPLSVMAEVHKSDFNLFRISQSSSYGNQSAGDWTITKSEVHKLSSFYVVSVDSDGEATYLAKLGLGDEYTIQVNGGGTITLRGSNGIKNLHINFSSNYDGNGIAYQLTVKHDGMTETYSYEDADEDGYFYDRTDPIAQENTYNFDNIKGEFELTISNTKSNSKWYDILFWDFTWEDCADDEPAIEAGDNNLVWSQKSGKYMNGTTIFVNGKKSGNLRLYNGEKLIAEKEALSGEIPTIYHTLEPNATSNLRAESEDVESVHTYVATNDGATPVPAISLPEGTYKPGTEFVVTGVPGKGLTVTYSAAHTGISTESVEADGLNAPVATLYLPGQMDETIRITLHSEGAEEVSCDYYLNRIWIPVDATTAIDFQTSGSLYVGDVLLTEYAGPQPVLNGLQISNKANGELWVRFTDAELLDDNGYVVKVNAGSTMTIGTGKKDGDTEISLNQIKIMQRDNEDTFTPGTYTAEDCSHTWTSPMQAPTTRTQSGTEREVTFTARKTVNILGIDTMHHVITRVDETEADRPSVSYYDLQGLPLREAPECGLYIEVSANGAGLVKKSE